jgi:NAD(P)-dependent dehydrogenase (short-subunit alcohol dehydrogenase family)
MPQINKPTSLVALVTGASRGIGRVIATQLAERGVCIALHYRDNREAAESALAGLAGSSITRVCTSSTRPCAPTTKPGNPHGASR